MKTATVGEFCGSFLVKLYQIFFRMANKSYPILQEKGISNITDLVGVAQDQS
jgi:hypothetical protein